MVGGGAWQDVWLEEKDGGSCLQDRLDTEEPGLVHPGKTYQMNRESYASSRAVRSKQKEELERQRIPGIDLIKQFMDIQKISNINRQGERREVGAMDIIL